MSPTAPQHRGAAQQRMPRYVLCASVPEETLTFHTKNRAVVQGCPWIALQPAGLLSRCSFSRLTLTGL